MTHIFVLTGPESTGKTSLAQLLAKFWDAPLVDEASRPYLEHKFQESGSYAYVQDDILSIGLLQQQAEDLALLQKPARLICDTDLLVLIIWSEVRYGHCDPHLLRMFEKSLQRQPQRQYILCDWQTPWEADPMRENPHNREELYGLYQDKLAHYQVPYTAVSGGPLRRFQQTLPLFATD